MITKLSQLTVDRFVLLASGDMSVMLAKGEKADDMVLMKTARDIMEDFGRIADSPAMRRRLDGLDGLTKARLSLLSLRLCRTLLDFGQVDDVRATLAEYGVAVGNMKESRIAAEVASRIARAERDIADIQSELDTQEASGDIIAGFDELTASMTAYYKFQIDTRKMKATVYARLITRMDEELKARIKSTANKKLT